MGREEVAGNREGEAGSMEEEAGSREEEAGSREEEAGSREEGLLMSGRKQEERPAMAASCCLSTL